MMKHVLKFCLLAMALLAAWPACAQSKTLKSIREIKQLKQDATFTVEFAPGTVQVAALERNEYGVVGGVYLWDGTDGLFLYYGGEPSWPVGSLKVGDYISGTMTGKWEYEYWDVYNLDGNVTIGSNAPVKAMANSGRDVVANGSFNKFGFYQMQGTFYPSNQRFVSDDGVSYIVEDYFRLSASAPSAATHCTLSAMFYQGDIANYLWPVAQNCFVTDATAFTPETVITDSEVYSLADLKKCRTKANLVFSNGYKAQVINILSNAYFLWDGKDGLLVFDASQVISAAVAPGKMITGGTLKCDTQNGLYGLVGQDNIKIEDATATIQALDKAVSAVTPADINGFYRLYGRVVNDSYGNYALTDGTDSVLLADKFAYGADFLSVLGQWGHVSAVYHAVGNRFLVHPKAFFSPGATGVTSPHSLAGEKRDGRVYGIDGRCYGHDMPQGHGVFVKDGKKIVR